MLLNKDSSITQRDQRVLQHSYLVAASAVRLARQLSVHVEISDLKSAGMLGLLDAAVKFQPERNVPFCVYANRRIRGAMLDYVRQLAWVPREEYRRQRAECPEGHPVVQPVSLEEIQLTDDQAGPDSLYAHAEMRKALRDAISGLPPKYQAVLFLYYLQQRSMREISVLLELNESRISQIHSSALAKMRSNLQSNKIYSLHNF